MAEVKEALSTLDSWLSFVVFDPRRLPEDQNLLVSYGDDEMEKLLSHYGKDHADIYKGETLHQSANPITNQVLAVWNSFKGVIFERRRLFQSVVEEKIAKETSKCHKPIGKTAERVYTSCIFQFS